MVGTNVCGDVGIAGLHSVDYITLATLWVFFSFKWTAPCLLRWDAPLLFRKVMGKLFVVDKWAATRETLWPNGLSAGLGGRIFLYPNPGSAPGYSFCDPWGNVVLVPPVCAVTLTLDVAVDVHGCSALLRVCARGLNLSALQSQPCSRLLLLNFVGGTALQSSLWGCSVLLCGLFHVAVFFEG